MKQIYLIRKVAVILIFSALSAALAGQNPSGKEFLKAVQNADMYYYYDENYLKAAGLYEPLLEADPDNYNLAAKLGICYLNLDGKSQEALRLLKKASQGVVSSAKEYKQTGTGAPLDTYLYLAVAFHQNDSLQQALTFFNNVKKSLSEEDTYQSDFIDLQIRNCRYAMEMKKRPLRLITNYFAPWMEAYPGACNPVLAKNDSVFVFTVKNEGITQVYCSYKKGNTWQEPSNITKQLGGYDRFYTNSITGDGKLLILFMDDGGDGNIYYSVRKDTSWTKIRSIGKYVNSIYWEAHGFITPDGKTMYFSSNRPGGEGELDIWTSDRLPDGSWERPVNCGNIINTPYDESTPYFDTEENALLFSSIGHISMGGYDVFRSVKRGSSWTQPVGMPYAFNTVQENTNFILNNGAPGFIASRYDDKINQRNIYAVVAVDPADEITRAEGTIQLGDGMQVDPAISLITVKNLKTGEIMQNIPVSPDGTFHFDIKPGDYEVYVSHDGYQTDTISLNLPLYFAGKFLAVNPSLEPEKVTTGEFLAIKNVLFDFDKYDITEENKPKLETIRNIIVSHPDLTIEVAGYTDAVGSTEYNRKLADKRAQSVIDYLASTGIENSKLIKKAFGESNFAAVNRNPDGTDNPEGRKYNRRVTFGIVNPKTGVVIRQEAYTPPQLRQPGSMKYSIVLKKTKDKLHSGYFNNLIKGELLFVRTLKTDDYFTYALGVFYNKADALTYLGNLQETGLKDAYVVDQYELENGAYGDASAQPGTLIISSQKVYVIQLKATRNPINIKSIFPGYEGVRELRNGDGYYKYIFGEYKSISEARKALEDIKKDYSDAFIRESDSLK